MLGRSKVFFKKVQRGAENAEKHFALSALNRSLSKKL